MQADTHLCTYSYLFFRIFAWACYASYYEASEAWILCVMMLCFARILLFSTQEHIWVITQTSVQDWAWSKLLRKILQIKANVSSRPQGAYHEPTSWRSTLAYTRTSTITFIRCILTYMHTWTYWLRAGTDWSHPAQVCHAVASRLRAIPPGMRTCTMQQHAHEFVHALARPDAG
jgi:hypothetical protein